MTVREKASLIRDQIIGRADPCDLERARGCLLGGAVGDALGAPVEFLSHAAITKRFGVDGIRDYVAAYGRIGAITDDTQMTLFTAEGLMRARVRRAIHGNCDPIGMVAQAYQRWLRTQSEAFGVDANEGWLASLPELQHRRAPGMTCLSALKGHSSGSLRADNQSKGCGAVMRVAPVGLVGALMPDTCTPAATRLRDMFEQAVVIAAITHGHVTGQLTSGVMAVVISLLLQRYPLKLAIRLAQELLRSFDGHEETDQAISAAMELAESHPNNVRALSLLGEGWTAEEALAISLYAAASSTSFEAGVVLAVNHGGDSDSTGSMTGSLLGAEHGLSAIPKRWLASLELREVIESVADDLTSMPRWEIEPDDARFAHERDYLRARYPGS